jgi:hypothetical protein
MARFCDRAGFSENAQGSRLVTFFDRREERDTLHRAVHALPNFSTDGQTPDLATTGEGKGGARANVARRASRYRRLVIGSMGGNQQAVLAEVTGAGGRRFTSDHSHGAVARPPATLTRAGASLRVS